MVCKEDIKTALDSMILSASGWRGVFAVPDSSDDDDGEESTTGLISQTHRIISGAAAMIFAESLGASIPNPQSPVPSPKHIVLVGTDTRPTGKAIADALIAVLLACGCDVQYAGVVAAPEIMAWARSASAKEQGAKGFVYVSASHNPIGHNGLKFGLTDGGVLAAEEATKLIKNFRAFFETDDCVEKIEALSAAGSGRLNDVYAGTADAKTVARNAYFDFCGEVAWGGNNAIASAVSDGLKEKPLGIVCDFNGSARTVSADKELFESLGLKFECINAEPGRIAHRIVPEGESLDPCRELLERAHARDASFTLGYVPDCDGDRGNLVIWDDAAKKARALEAQEVFALACVAELSHLVWAGELAYDGDGKALSKAAVAVNDPTSMIIDRIAKAFGVSVFRAEVGEANVVSLARKLRQDGYTVRILGEGSAGGNITHPSAVRDPVSTVLALVKLLSVRSSAEKPGFSKSIPSPQSLVPSPHYGLFELWCKLSGQMEKYRVNFTLSHIIASLPEFFSTPAYSKDAILRIKTKDHAILKGRYQKIFLREWEDRKTELKTRCDFHRWEAIAYNGLNEKRGLTNFAQAGKGGLKISFFNGAGEEAAYIWMRGSATEPVFRIMADVENPPDGTGRELERFLLDWQRRMITEADEFVDSI